MRDHIDTDTAIGSNKSTFIKTDDHNVDVQNTLARSNFYRFLATLYLQPPTPEILQCFADSTIIDEFRVLFGDEVISEFKLLNQLNEQNCSALGQEYMALFVVPGGCYVTPFEDVYRGLRLDGKQERGPLLGDRAVAVKRIYRSAGANLDKTCKELPTHIGIELLFMSFLSEQEANCNNHELIDELKETQEDITTADIFRQWQLKFLHEHLTDWFPQLSQAIQDKTESAFYRGIAKLTNIFLIRDKDELIKQLHKDLQKYANQIKGQTSTESKLQ